MRSLGTLRDGAEINDGCAQIRDALKPGYRASQCAFLAECVQPDLIRSSARSSIPVPDGRPASRTKDPGQSSANKATLRCRNSTKYACV